MTRYVCPRCGYVLTSAVKPEFIKKPTCPGNMPGHHKHIKPAVMELQNDG